MTIRGPLTHVDLSISDPDCAIPFYDVLFRALGYYAAFLADPDEIEIEVACIPDSNP